MSKKQPMKKNYPLPWADWCSAILWAMATLEDSSHVILLLPQVFLLIVTLRGMECFFSQYELAVQLCLLPASCLPQAYLLGAGRVGKQESLDAAQALLSSSQNIGVSKVVLATIWNAELYRLLGRHCPSQTQYTSINCLFCFHPFQDQDLHSLLTLKLLPWCLFLPCGQLCSSWCSYSLD